MLKAGKGDALAMSAGHVARGSFGAYDRQRALDMLGAELDDELVKLQAAQAVRARVDSGEAAIEHGKQHGFSVSYPRRQIFTRVGPGAKTGGGHHVIKPIEFMPAKASDNIFPLLGW